MNWVIVLTMETLTANMLKDLAIPSKNIWGSQSSIKMQGFKIGNQYELYKIWPLHQLKQSNPQEGYTQERQRQVPQTK